MNNNAIAKNGIYLGVIARQGCINKVWKIGETSNFFHKREYQIKRAEGYSDKFHMIAFIPMPNANKSQRLFAESYIRLAFQLANMQHSGNDKLVGNMTEAKAIDIFYKSAEIAFQQIELMQAEFGDSQ